MCSYIIGHVELVAELQRNVSTLPMNSLCCSVGDSTASVQLTYLESAQALRPIVHNFSRLYQGKLFQNMWTAQLSKISEAKVSLPFAEVVSKIWNPVFEECAWLVDGLQSRSIKLKCIDYYFRSLDSSEVLAHLKTLYVSMETCHGRAGRSPAWIRIAVSRIHQYWSLCAQAKAAKIVLGLKEKLGLNGDFHVIEGVAGEIAESMKDSTLDDIDQNLSDAKSFLDEITKDEWKLQCLKSFSECTNIVEWIRKVSKGVCVPCSLGTPAKQA